MLEQVVHLVQLHLRAMPFLQLSIKRRQRLLTSLSKQSVASVVRFIKRDRKSDRAM
jgi:hypothetical protein